MNYFVTATLIGRKRTKKEKKSLEKRIRWSTDFTNLLIKCTILAERLIF